MNARNLAKKAAPSVVVFSLAFVGVLALAPRDDGDGDDLVPVVVATRTLADGTTTNEVRRGAEVRMIPEAARAEGALTALEQVPRGVLAYDHVVGQQVLATSFARSNVSGLGADFVAVSVRLDPQRWLGPWLQAGRIVDVYDTRDSNPTRVAVGAVILDVPASLATSDVDPSDDAVVSLGVPSGALSAVLSAAQNDTVWLVGR